MPNLTLYLIWNYDGVSWTSKNVRKHIPDTDNSARVHLESYIEEYYVVAQLHEDYVSMYIEYIENPIIPPPCIMKSPEGLTITVSFSFKEPQ